MRWEFFAQAGELRDDVGRAKRRVGTGLVVVELVFAIFLESDKGKDPGNITLFFHLLESGDAFVSFLGLVFGENVDGGAIFRAKTMVGCAGVSGKVNGNEQVLGSDHWVKSDEDCF